MHRVSAKLWIPCLPLALLVVAGCAADVSKDVTNHVVMINGRGNPVDPTRSHNKVLRFFKPYERYEPAERYKEHFGAVLRTAREKTEEHLAKHGKRRVVIFIHGGLNTQVSTLERASKLRSPMVDHDYFPIFINWQSNLFSSYFDHLLWVRQGKWRSWGPILFPLYALNDLARGVTRAPLTWGWMLYNDLEASVELEDSHHARRAFERLEAEYRAALGSGGHAGTIAISAGRDLRGPWEKTVSFFKYVLTLPTKLLIAPLLDAWGTPSWEIMLRRTHMLYHKEGESTHLAGQLSPPPEGEGGLAEFMRMFRDTIGDEHHEWELTLVGHSMGTIIINEMLRRFPDMHFSNIVYMAAACTTRDYEDSVFPYLARHTETQFYHLVLHPEAEVRERWDLLPVPGLIDLPPRGSLLVWIDSFFTKPETPLDRRLGHWRDLVVSLRNTPSPSSADPNVPDLRSRMHVKAFGVGRAVADREPQEHGDFNERRFGFWRDAFREPERHEP